MDRSHNIRKDNRSEDPLPILRMVLARQELLDMVQQQTAVIHPKYMIGAR